MQRPEHAPAPPIDTATANAALAGASATDVLAWAAQTYGSPDRSALRLASSMGAEDVVLVHLVSTLPEELRATFGIFMLDTGRLHQETYDVVDRLKITTGLPIEVFVPAAGPLQSLLGEHGPNSFYDSIEARKACCRVRKIEPLGRALDGAAAWVTGLRRGQGVTRTTTAFVEADPGRNGVVKINPLAYWSHEDVWNYIRTHSVPYNALHDQGYPSIGCAPCTRAIAPGEDIRAGRWWWENPDLRECGLHGGARKTKKDAVPTGDRASTPLSLAPEPPR